MLSQLTRCAKKLWARLSSAANQLFRRLTEPAHPTLVTGTLADLRRSRGELLAENALLRQQLIVLRCNTKTPRLTRQERLSLVFLARLVPNWKQVLQIIQPATLLRWHREGFRLFSPVLAAEIAPAGADAAPAPATRDNCFDRAVSGHHQADEWITQPVRDATPFDEKPKYLICDNDKRYGPLFEQVAQASGIEVIHTPYEAPRAKANCERIVGSLRRECLDHILVIGELQLIRVLKEYASYFNPARPHTCTCGRCKCQGIAQQIPGPRVLPPGEPKVGKVLAFPVLNGLHHDYRWAAA